MELGAGWDQGKAAPRQRRPGRPNKQRSGSRTREFQLAQRYRAALAGLGRVHPDCTRLASHSDTLNMPVDKLAWVTKAII